MAKGACVAKVQCTQEQEMSFCHNYGVKYIEIALVEQHV